MCYGITALNSFLIINILKTILMIPLLTFKFAIEDCTSIVNIAEPIITEL